MTQAQVLGLDVSTYQRHALHHEDQAWVEKNCYIDVWIETLHALGLDPHAVLPFTLAVDFEGDQWTFFKPPHVDLATLYGLDVQELNVWRPLVEHAVSHLREGKLLFTEADAFYLPDTQGTDYRTQHTKTTIVLESIDVEQKRLGYFHNASYHALEGEDFVRTFRLDLPPDPTFMPFFAEFVRIDRKRALPPQELVGRSTALLRRSLLQRPLHNPLTRFSQRFIADIEQLKGEGLARYHAYAFATLRQLGANFELTARYLQWLARVGNLDTSSAAQSFESISSHAKTLILKGARAVNSKRPTDFSEALGTMEKSWDEGMKELDARFGAPTAVA